jgi:tRNA(Leu) C34 or U34 (ribose-2'-O)-methylase TrmL
MTPVFHARAGVIKGFTVNTLRKAVNTSAALHRLARPSAYDSSGKVLQKSGSDKPHYIGQVDHMAWLTWNPHFLYLVTWK